MNGKRYAVLVGASQFPQDDKLEDLRSPENDVDDFAAVLSDPARGAFTEVHVLKNEPHHQVLRTINQVLKRAEKDTLVLIYYSGHGKLDSAGRLYLATTDTEIELLETTAVPVESIKTIIDVTPSTATALMLDCCYGGAVEKAFFKGSLDEQLDRMSGGRGTFIMTAATALQLAKENEGDRNGIFTKHLLEGIRSGAADRDGNGVITMDELYQYVHRQVTEESHQEPVKSDVGVRGQLIVAKSGRMPRKERYTKARRRLLSLAGKGAIADKLLAEALKVANKQKQDLDPQELEYDQLIDAFMAKKLSVGEFQWQWQMIGRRRIQAPPIEKPEVALAKRNAEEEERQRAETEAKRKAEEEERKQADEEARRKVEEERKREFAQARREAEENEHQRAETEAKRKAEEEERKQADEEARRKAEEERKREFAQARREAGENERQRAKAEVVRKVEGEERQPAEAKARRRAEAVEVEKKRKAEERRISEWIEAERRAAGGEVARRSDDEELNGVEDSDQLQVEDKDTAEWIEAERSVSKLIQKGKIGHDAAAFSLFFLFAFIVTVFLVIISQYERYW